MSANTERKRDEEREARRTLDRAQRSNRQFYSPLIFLGVCVLLMLGGSIVLFFAEHLQPYTEADLAKARAGQTIGTGFYGAMGIMGLTFTVMGVIVACWVGSQTKHKLTSSRDLQKLRWDIEDAARAVTEAEQADMEDEVKRYQPRQP